MEPPKSIDAEQQVLGSILKETELINTVIEFLPSEDYYYLPKHRMIYRAILELNNKGEACDVTTVAEELLRQGNLDRIGGRVYLIDLVGGVATTAHLESHAKIVLDRATLRKLITTSTDIVKSCYAMESDVIELLDQAESNIFSISESRLRTGFISLNDLIPKTFEQIEQFQDTKGGLKGINTGYVELDNMTGGLHNGDFVVIAGRPSMGKTALALNMAENIAIKEKIPVGIFSIEMSKEQLALRMLCGKSGINQHLLRTGRLKDSEWQKLTLGADTLANAEIHIDDSGALTALEMRAKARRLKSQHNVGLIIVDYIQMMTGAARIENRQQEMSMISRAFKSLAKELNIPVIAVSQLSRAVEQRGQDKMPQLSDLRESGALEQDADLVMFVYREAYYMKPDDARYPEVENLAVIKVAKQRNGPTGNVKMAFIRDYIRFENLAAQYGQEVPIADEGTPF